MNTFYWDGLANERVFMEITDRDDLGVDLRAPLSARGGVPTGRYLLVAVVRPGDVVLHYRSDDRALIATSVAVGSPEPAPIYWVARGTYARRAQAQAQWVPGIRVPLNSLNAIEPPVPLQELRAHEAELMAVHADMKRRFPGQSLYFPWVPYKGQPMRTFESYLVKVPDAVVAYCPGSRTRSGDQSGPPQVGSNQDLVSISLAERSALRHDRVTGRDRGSQLTRR